MQAVSDIFALVLLANRLVRLVIDAAEQCGVDRAALVRALGPTGPALVAPGARLEWGAMMAMFDELDRLVGGDHEVLRAIGRGMRSSRSPDVVRDVARGLLDARDLYRFLDRWMAPAFPHLRIFMRFVTPRRLQAHGDIPEPHATSIAFLHVIDGRITALPEMIGLPPCTVVERRIGPRSLDVVLDLPVDRSAKARVRRAARALFSRHRTRFALEAQRQALAENLDALSRARDELRVLLDGLPDLVLVHRSGRLVWGNEIAVKALGYQSVEQLAGLPLLDIVAPRSSSPAEAYFARSGGDRSMTELVLRSRTGEELTVEAAAEQDVVLDGMGGRMVVARDVTERSRMQQRLIVADRLASIGLLAAGVAHEVNNPLAYVLNNIEIARRDASSDELRRNALGLALEGVERIRTIVRDLLRLSRGDETPAGPVDIRSVVESTLALARPQVERTTRLVTQLETAPLVMASAARLGQVLLNLVSNALEALRDRAPEDNVLRVHVGCADDGRALLEVSDNGRGIPPQDLPRVFEPFFTTKPATEGTGLGLTIAQRLVVELGGEMTVSSVVGRGTTFRVLLAPIAHPP